jgi:hypothetical protein
MPFLIGASILGLGLNLWGTLTGASAQASAAEANARAKAQQADELLAREQINEDIMREQSRRSELSYASGAAMGESGGGIGGILTMKKDLETSINNSRHEADFKAKMLRAGAEIDSNLASDMQTAGALSGAGTLLSTGADFYSKWKKYGSPNADTTKGLWG